MSDEVSIPAGPSYRVPLQPRRRYDPARRMRLMIAGGLGAVVFAWFASSMLLSGRGGSVPVVQAQAGPLRVKPANPGGLQVDSAENAIFSGGAGNGEDTLAPPPQTPDPQALQAPPRRTAAPTPAASAALAPPPTALAPPPAAHATEAPAIAAARKPPAAATEPRPAVAAVLPKPAADRHALAAVAADHSANPPVSNASHGALVQLAALSSQQGALEEWSLLAKRMPQLLAGRQPSVSKVERDGHTYWRLRTGGFADTAKATMFCLRMRASGASCSVADF